MAVRHTEIRDWTRAVGRRLWIVILIPIVASGAAGTIAFLDGVRYRATATVVLPSVRSTGGPLTAAVAQEVDDFQGVLSSDRVAQLTAESTGEPKGSYLDGISTHRHGTSSAVEVVFIGSDPGRAEAVVVDASRDAFLVLAETDLTVAQAQADAAEEAFTAAQQALDEFAQRSNIVDADVAFAEYQRRLTSLRDALGKAEDGGDPKEIQAAQQKLTQRTQTFTAFVSEYTVLDGGRIAARDSLRSSTLELFRATGAVEAAKKAEVTASPATEVSRIAYVGRRAIAAAAFGLVLAVGLVILLELVRPGEAAGADGSVELFGSRGEAPRELRLKD